MLSIQEGDEPLRFACNNINGVHIKITKKHLCISNIYIKNGNSKIFKTYYMTCKQL
jgi:hypothetical protein